MNMLTISAAGLIIFTAMMNVALFMERFIAQKLAASSNRTLAMLGAGAATIVH